MECKWTESLYEKRICRLFLERGCRYFLCAGDKTSGRTDRLGTGRISFLLELCGEKGYSGTAIFTKKEPVAVSYGLGIEEHDKEGRVITLEFEDFYFITVYTPNSQSELARLSYRMQWEDDFLQYLNGLKEKKPVVFCGDLNVAHKEIDLKNPKTNRKNAGFTDEERGKFTDLLAAGYTDSFRYLYPDVEGMYSWWSYRFKAREKNAGWRIDYFVVSDDRKDKIKKAEIRTEIMGSDHCPVILEME